MVLRSDQLHASNLELIKNLESNITWDILAYAETNVICSARLLERQIEDALLILYRPENHEVQWNLFLRENKVVYRRHVSCHGAMYARVLFSEYRTEGPAIRHMRKFMQDVIEVHFISDERPLYPTSDSSDSSE